MKKTSLKDAIVDMVFEIVDLPCLTDPTRVGKEKKLKNKLRKKLMKLEKKVLSDNICFDRIKNGDRERLIQIIRFIDDPYFEAKMPGVDLLAMISKSLLKPVTFDKHKLSFKDDVKSLFQFINEKELSVRSKNCQKCLSYVERRISNICNATMAQRYSLSGFMPDDGWMLQVIRASDFCACNEKNIKNIDFLMTAITGGGERKRYFV